MQQLELVSLYPLRLHCSKYTGRQNRAAAPHGDLPMDLRREALIDEEPVLLPCHSLHGPLRPLPSETGAAPASDRQLAGSPAAAAGGMGAAAGARSSPRPPPGVSPRTCLPHAIAAADVYRACVGCPASEPTSSCDELDRRRPGLQALILSTRHVVLRPPGPGRSPL